MALLLYDGFDNYYNDTDFGSIYLYLTEQGAGATQGAQFLPGRFSGNSFSFDFYRSNLSSFNSVYLKRFLNSTYTNITIGIALYCPADFPYAFQIQLFDYVNGCLASAQWNYIVGASCYTGDGFATPALQVASNPTNRLAQNAWNYLEVNFVINESVGSITMVQNSETIISALNVNTSPFGTSANCIGFSTSLPNFTGGTALQIDDLYVIDNTGSAPLNSFLGDVRVATLFPNGQGASTQWSPSITGSANWSMVNTPNNGATYVTSDTSGQEDLYTIQELNQATEIFAASVNYFAKKDNAGVRYVASALKSGTTLVVGAEHNMVGSYQFYSDLYLVDPDTGMPWTFNAINAAQIGLKLIT